MSVVGLIPRHASLDLYHKSNFLFMFSNDIDDAYLGVKLQAPSFKLYSLTKSCPSWGERKPQACDPILCTYIIYLVVPQS